MLLSRLKSLLCHLSDAVVSAALDRVWVKVANDLPEIAALLAGDEIEVAVVVKVRLRKPGEDETPQEGQGQGQTSA